MDLYNRAIKIKMKDERGIALVKLHILRFADWMLKVQRIQVIDSIK